MAQSISFLGATYSDVPAVLLPKQGGGTARFDDASVTTAVSSDVASGKLFLASDGTVTTGTASGGGGSSYTLVTTQDIAINHSSTSSTSYGTISLGYHTKDEILYVCIRDKAGKRAGYFYGSDNFIIDYMYGNGSASLQSFLPRAIYGCDGNGKLANANSTSSFTSTTSSYGVIATSINKSGVIGITAKYNSAYGTINGTFRVEVYKLLWPENRNPLD